MEIYFTHIHTLNPTALILMISTILISVYSKKITSKISGSFIAIIDITLVVQLFDLPVTTIESFFGEIPTTISISFPAIEWASMTQYIAPAITIALPGAIESLLFAVVADGMIGGNHRSNTELIAQGVANIVTPFTYGSPLPLPRPTMLNKKLIQKNALSVFCQPAVRRSTIVTTKKNKDQADLILLFTFLI